MALLQPPPEKEEEKEEEKERALEALVERLGGRERVLLVAADGAASAAAAAAAAPSSSSSSPRALLETFAWDLFGREEKEEEKAKAGAQSPPPPSRREVRVRGSSPPAASPPPPPAPAPPFWGSCGLLFLLVGAPSLLPGAPRRILRETLRDVRAQILRRRRSPSSSDGAPPPPPPLAVVGVVVVRQPPPPPPLPRDVSEAQAQLEALLRQTFRRGRPGEDPAAAAPFLQASTYSPGRAGPVRDAAYRALRAALQLRTDVVETKKQKLPIFLQCFPWNRRRQQRKGHFGTEANKLNEDTPQDSEEGVALTTMAPNGNCEDACGVLGT